MMCEDHVTHKAGVMTVENSDLPPEEICFNYIKIENIILKCV